MAILTMATLTTVVVSTACLPWQALRMEEDESLELWYLLCCAALQAGELELGAAEAAAALEFAESDACPEDEKEWMEQLGELQADIAEAAAAAPQ